MAAGRGESLTVDDFCFGGPLGSEGAAIERVGRNHFHVTLAHAPGHPEWANMLQFTIPHGARGNALRLDVAFHGAVGMLFNTYYNSWSHDGCAWRPIQWEKGFEKEPDSARGDTLVFPEFREDAVLFGAQVPMTCEQLGEMLSAWAGASPHATPVEIGKSLGGRPVWRLEVTGAAGAVPRQERRAHYVVNLHPLEYNARWRMVGMVRWLLSDAAAAFRDRNVCHFVFLTSPDSIPAGWYRVNAQGVDMNRSYRIEGSDRSTQAHEAWLAQRDLERLAAGPAGLSTLWTMHTCVGGVFPVMFPGPEIGRDLGPWTDLRDAIARHDGGGLCAALRLAKEIDRTGGTTCWEVGPYEQFDITTFLIEGGGTILTRDDNMASGETLIRGLADYCLSARS